jgi:predicted RNA methylase
MRSSRSAYELRRSQVETPPVIVALLWQLVRERRTVLPRVLDLGAGDARFSVGGSYKNYEGVEIDRAAVHGIRLPPNARVSIGCTFRHAGINYDACIGNPPYVRHHDLALRWKRATAKRIENELSISFDKHANLYLYFLCLALTKTAASGLLALVIPYEWVSRPSAAAIRQHIKEKGWNVSVYRFQGAIFPNVLTTASITIVDKEGRNGNSCGKLVVRSREKQDRDQPFAGGGGSSGATHKESQN